ncbi:MAG: hypothetical protein RLY14_504 [Planctomycetota bacterium]|jgi:gamma-glutamylcyclotransferase (GGCT)/AIG2-like uncharacterized protein YtfP
MDNADSTNSRTTMFYFAYGSNLNEENFHQWCERHRFTNIQLDYVAHAELPDHELAFTCESHSRGGGVLDVRPRLGQCVPGVIFQVNEEAIAALDAKEGAPTWYERKYVKVINGIGDFVPVLTYVVSDSKRQKYVKPSDSYLKIVQQGYRQHRINGRKLMAAAANRRSPLEDRFFFYGTLMRGESRFQLLKNFGIKCTVMAEVFGRLLNLGVHPGLIDSDNSDHRVSGDFMRLSRASSAIKLLDRIEGFFGYDRPHSLFQRTRTIVDIGEGEPQQAWVYRLVAGTEQAPIIPSGDWRLHHQRRTTFLEKLIEAHTGGDETRMLYQLAGKLPFRIGSREETIRFLSPLTQRLDEGVITERKLAEVSENWTALAN